MTITDPAEYRRIHDIPAAAYEAAVPVDYRYSALALRKAVDAAISAVAPPGPVAWPEEPTDDMIRALFTLNSATPRTTAEVIHVYKSLRALVSQNAPALEDNGGDLSEPMAWESTTPGYIKYVTDSRYQKFSDETKRWYKPYRCSECSPAPEATP